MVALQPIFIKAYWSLAALGTLYFCFLGALTHPWIQKQAIYANKVQLTWFKNLTIPEHFGFAANQVTPFFFRTPDNETLFAWHVLPLGLYNTHRDPLISQSLPRGPVASPLTTLNFQLLRSDPEARLIIHFHGNAGTVGAALRPAYLRSLSSASPDKIHILAIDYRGFGLSSGEPDEKGLITDGIAAVDYALNEIGIPPERIALVGQSLGTAVTFGVAEALARRVPKVEPKAVVSLAGFADMESIVRSYKIGGVLPVLSPLKMYPLLQKFFARYVRESWDSLGRVGSLVRNSPNANLIFAHAKNDWEIPYHHVDQLFLAAANATVPDENLKIAGLRERMQVTEYGAESKLAVWPETKGNQRIVQHVVAWGGHNHIVSSAGTSVMVAKALGL